MLVETLSLRHTPLVLQAQETTPPGRPAHPRLYRQKEDALGGCCLQPQSRKLPKRPISWRSATDSPAASGEKEGHRERPASSVVHLPRQGEAKRETRGHCEPASEPVMATPTHQGDCHRHSSPLDRKGRRRWPAAGTTAAWPGRALDFYGPRGGLSTLLLFQLLTSL